MVKRKIPLSYAPLLGLSKSFLVKVNQGARTLSVYSCLKLLSLFPDLYTFEDLRPDLAEKLRPLLCQKRRGRKAAGH